MKKIDIVLIKPGSQKQIYGELSDFALTAIEPPLWGAILAGYLRHLGYSVVLFDAEVENWSYEETARTVIDTDPLLAAVIVSGSNPSASTMNMTGAGKIVSLIKELSPEIKTLLGGLHPSALPEQTIREGNADFICQGEGFHTIPDLIDVLKSGAYDFNIDGLWYMQGNHIVKNHRPALVKDLGQIPMPAWDLLPMKKYRAHNWHCFDDIEKRQPYAILYTSLGCPFNCNFCCINALFGKHIIRYRPLADVIDEIDFLVKNYGVRNIKIIDEMFAMNEKRVVSLCDLIIQRGYNLNMWAYARVNTVTEKMLLKMKKAGINWVAYGFESGSRRVIESVTKGYKPELVMDVVKMTYDVGMHICGNYIFGLPEEDYESMNETFKMMLDINAEWANIYCAMAYPGSELYDRAIQDGWSLPENWHDYSQYSFESLPLPTKYLDSADVLSFRDYAFNAYYSNPNYLNMINDKFGSTTVSYIIETTAKKLNRKNKKY
ncbi:B12-binding domain-containing radical SAM protein [Desulfotignum phosphitoxidans]|uniref:ABC-2 type transporter n=1 Tax=Desulfotignum phosphitoxidans DSM 13687 TaxID=1286635 RepID=S0G518_9BACT|nr:radical SAM protein [Desulfotignum phosphitoxidans]EMS80864.1 ABC-2 type transporter [Desulfotignum phosphitoxidans DSM 13687]